MAEFVLPVRKPDPYVCVAPAAGKEGVQGFAHPVGKAGVSHPMSLGIVKLWMASRIGALPVRHCARQILPLPTSIPTTGRSLPNKERWGAAGGTGRGEAKEAEGSSFGGVLRI